MPSPIRFLPLLLVAGALGAAERTVDPTFLHRYIPDLPEKSAEFTTPTCHYRQIFGPGDSILRGVARYGELRVDAGGHCNSVQFPREEQAFMLLEGAGTLTYIDQKSPLRKNDFWYVAPGARYTLAGGPLRAIVMGYKVPAGAAPSGPLMLANSDDMRKQTVGGHPPSTLYQLLMGDTKSTRDKIAAGHVLTSLFIMEFAPGGTNFPHHHETEEEIYLLLDGAGDMVAGGGMDGVEGRHPARPGDAYFIRLNCTVGFYSSANPGQKAHILAVRSLFPFRNR